MTWKQIVNAIALLCATASPALGQVEHRHDYEEALKAVQQGEALPLAVVLARVGDRLGGEVLAIEIERENGRWVYEFRIVDGNGQRRAVYVDAATAEVVKRERR